MAIVSRDSPVLGLVECHGLVHFLFTFTFFFGISKTLIPLFIISKGSCRLKRLERKSVECINVNSRRLSRKVLLDFILNRRHLTLYKLHDFSQVVLEPEWLLTRYFIINGPLRLINGIVLVRVTGLEIKYLGLAVNFSGSPSRAQTVPMGPGVPDGYRVQCHLVRINLV